jgi:hypothetical protein
MTTCFAQRTAYTAFLGHGGHLRFRDWYLAQQRLRHLHHDCALAAANTQVWASYPWAEVQAQIQHLARLLAENGRTVALTAAERDQILQQVVHPYDPAVVIPE